MKSQNIATDAIEEALRETANRRNAALNSGDKTIERECNALLTDLHEAARSAREVDNYLNRGAVEFDPSW